MVSILQRALCILAKYFLFISILWPFGMEKKNHLDDQFFFSI